MTSKEYWQKRETEHAKKNKMSEQTYAEEIRKTYAYMADQIQKEIDGFYAKYANAEKISLAEAKRRVSKLDIEEYGRKAAKYVKEKDFSDQANEEMRLYNATMKINRLELLKANIGLEMVSGFDELQKYFDKTLTQQTIEEFRRQAGILGNSVQENGKMARAIVDASFHNATYSDRIWMYQDMLKAELDKLLEDGRAALSGLSCRELVTFHDGFSYFARAFRLTIAAAMEIEEGSEPSAKEIESVIRLVEDENIPAVFCEENGERQTAETVAKQTGTGLFALTMGMDGGAAGCTDAIYHNIDIIREALS